MCARTHSHVWLFVTPQTVAHQASLSVGLSWQEYWSGLPLPPPGESSQPRNHCCLALCTSPTWPGLASLTWLSNPLNYRDSLVPDNWLAHLMSIPPINGSLPHPQNSEGYCHVLLTLCCTQWGCCSRPLLHTDKIPCPLNHWCLCHCLGSFFGLQAGPL